MGDILSMYCYHDSSWWTKRGAGVPCGTQIGRKRLKVQHKQERRYSSSAVTSLTSRAARATMARYSSSASASPTSPLAAAGFGATSPGGGAAGMDSYLSMPPGRGWRSTLMQQQPQQQQTPTSSSASSTPTGTGYRRPPAPGFSPTASPSVGRSRSSCPPSSDVLCHRSECVPDIYTHMVCHMDRSKLGRWWSCA